MKHQVSKILTQKERIADELFKLSKNVTEEDRKDFIGKNKVSHATLSGYLNNKVANADLGLKMVVFFRAKISERETILKQKIGDTFLDTGSGSIGETK